MVELTGPYRTRTIRFLDLWSFESWRMKNYGISYDGRGPSELRIDSARRVAGDGLATSAAGANHYGVAFIGVHQGRTGNFLFVDWWADENELHHHVYVSPLERPADIEYATPTGLAACAWDLFLVGHERDSWVNNVLRFSDNPDLYGYLQARLNTNA
jgi:prepilin-type processing-associated H-X9-DG protein